MDGRNGGRICAESGDKNVVCFLKYLKRKASLPTGNDALFIRELKLILDEFMTAHFTSILKNQDVISFS